MKRIQFHGDRIEQLERSLRETTNTLNYKQELRGSAEDKLGEICEEEIRKEAH